MTRRLLALAAVPPRRIGLAVALGALAAVCGIGLMATAGYLISRAAEQPPILALTTAIVAVRFFGISRPLARYLERLATHDVALRSLARVRARVYGRLEPLAPGGLEAYAHGDLLVRMVADVDALQGLHPRVVIPPLVAAAAAAAAIGAAAAVLPVAALVLAGGLLLAGVAVPALAGRLHDRSGRRQAALRADLATELVELVRGAPELEVYGAGGAALTRVRAADTALVGVARRDARAAGVADGLGVAVTGATVAAVLSLAVHAGDLDRVMIALLALLALASFEAVQPLGAAARELREILGAGRRVLDVLDRTPPVADPPAPLDPPVGPVALALERVRSRGAIDAFDLRLDPGRRVALVGASGAGKSTVVDLLLRFADPEEGRVTLNGRDLRAYRQDDVRRLIAVVGQEAHLFSATLRENVRLARPDAADGEVRRALRRAGLGSLCNALDAHVGEEGRRLSGGQRQRVALARALLADAPVLVLDEPTAHLDEVTAERLMADVLAASGERSVLLITHRPEGLDRVDEIVPIG